MFRCFYRRPRTTRNISLNGMNGRRSRKDVAQKHRGVVKFGAHCQVRFRGFSMATPGESTMIKNGKCVNVKNVKNIATDDDKYIPFPTMPCTSASNQSHRTKISSEGLGSKLFNAMVSRPVGRAEIESNPKAKEAMLKEWKGLRDQEVFDFTMVREYDGRCCRGQEEQKGSTYGQGPWHMRGKELPAVRRQSWTKIQGKRRFC